LIETPRRLRLRFGAEHLLGAGLGVVRHAREVIDPFSAPAPIALDQASSGRGWRTRSCAFGCWSGGDWRRRLGDAISLRKLERGLPQAAPLTARADLIGDVVLAVFAKGGGPSALDHRAIELRVSGRADRHEPTIRIVLVAFAVDPRVTNYRRELAPRFLPAGPDLAIAIACLPKLGASIP